MRKPLIHCLLLTLVFLSSACGNAKFNGKGKKKNKNQDQTTIVDPPAACKEGETCVVVDPDKCKAGEKDCPVVPKPPLPPTPPTDDCKDKNDGKDCPVVPPHTDCDEPSQNPNQNSGGKTCPTKDDPKQNDPAQQN